MMGIIGNDAGGNKGKRPSLVNHTANTIHYHHAHHHHHHHHHHILKFLKNNPRKINYP